MQSDHISLLRHQYRTVGVLFNVTVDYCFTVSSVLGIMAMIQPVQVKVKGKVVPVLN